MNQNLYDTDYHLWLEKTVQILQERKLKDLDIPNLIEEISDMGISQKKAVKSNLKILLCHLLKYKYQPEKRSKSWLSTIFEHRDRLEDDFSDSPSLKRYFGEVFEPCYQKARKQASIETGLPLEIFPINCPFTHEKVLNMDYLPE
ncbi:DUF29 domain-containing protein [Crocosphaera sp.]|uniref:DUF29 domain-containing protein n=1 Tax=Crocosphaera sp. TaxID=2729996 RepID=UPI0026111CF2|nr:DUF29 domain-containing protein [Crocosphaera sp.]MDJ0580162.1 DUF29 domain-containing protein [Crocosphaera sp.]